MLHAEESEIYRNSSGAQLKIYGCKALQMPSGTRAGITVQGLSLGLFLLVPGSTSTPSQTLQVTPENQSALLAPALCSCVLFPDFCRLKNIYFRCFCGNSVFHTVCFLLQGKFKLYKVTELWEDFWDYSPDAWTFHTASEASRSAGQAPSGTAILYAFLRKSEPVS